MTDGTTGSRGSAGSTAAAGFGFGVASAATFALAGPLAGALLAVGWTPGSASLIRLVGGAALLAVPTLVLLRGRWAAVAAQWRLLVGYGAFAMAGTQLAFFNAVQYLPVGVALLIEYLAPVLLVGWLWAGHGQRPRTLTVGGIAAAALGLVLVIDLTGARVDPVGLLWALGAAVALAVYFATAAAMPQELPGVALSGIGMVLGAVVAVTASLLGVMPLAVTTSDVLLAGQVLPWWVPAAGLVAFCSVISYLTGVAAAQRLGAKLASFLGLIEVLLSVVFAWWLLGQQLSAVQLLGGAIILIGVTCVRYDERVPAADTPERLLGAG